MNSFLDRNELEPTSGLYVISVLDTKQRHLMHVSKGAF